MKAAFYTVTIEDSCYDLPKDMPIPSKGSLIFAGGKCGEVDKVNYHISDKDFYTISVSTKNPYITL
jgi:hypothetical protein